MPFGNAARRVERQVAGLEWLGSQLSYSRRGGRAGHQDPDGHRGPPRPTPAKAWNGSRREMAGLSDKVETALLLREQVDSFLSLQGPLTALRTDSETLRTQLSEQAENVARMRTQHDDALTAHRHTTSQTGKLRSGLPDRHRQARGRSAPGTVGRACARADQPGLHLDSRCPAPAGRAQGAGRSGGPEDHDAGAGARSRGPRREPDRSADPNGPGARCLAPPAGGADPPVWPDRGQAQRSEDDSGQGPVPDRGAPGRPPRRSRMPSSPPVRCSPICASRCERAAKGSSWSIAACTPSASASPTFATP